MELKQAIKENREITELLLIVPYGIETLNSQPKQLYHQIF